MADDDVDVDGEEEEVIEAGPRRSRWGWTPPPLFGDDRPPEPVLRSFEPPLRRAARDRDTGAEDDRDDCHYHVWPTDEMRFHRAVRCHPHADPTDPSIRRVR